MIFFMVKVYENMFDTLQVKSESFSDNEVIAEKSLYLKIDNDNNSVKDNKNFKHKYIKVFVKDPYNNRDTILKLTKRQRGVYV